MITRIFTDVRHYLILGLAGAVVLLWVWHLRDSSALAADKYHIAIDGQNQAALSDTVRTLKNGMTAKDAVIANDSAGLASLGPQYASLAVAYSGLKKEHAQLLAAWQESLSVHVPAMSTPVVNHKFLLDTACGGFHMIESGESYADLLKNILL